MNDYLTNNYLDVQRVIDAHLAKPRPHRSSGKLWASDVGNCPRKAMLRVHRAKPTDDPDADNPMAPWVRVTAAFGNAIEENLTGVALSDILETDGGITVDGNPTFKGLTKHWSGRPDFVVGHGTNDVTIIEHKTTGGDHKPERWKIPSPFFPKVAHVGQLTLYGYVYEKAFGIKPKLILFYRTFKNHAQFNITVNHLETRAVGHINGTPVDVLVPINPLHIIAEYERLFDNDIVPPPHKEGTSGYATQCTFHGRVNCRYFSACHMGARIDYAPKPTNDDPNLAPNEPDEEKGLRTPAPPEKPVTAQISGVTKDDILAAADYSDPNPRKFDVEDIAW